MFPQQPPITTATPQQPPRLNSQTRPATCAQNTGVLPRSVTTANSFIPMTTLPGNQAVSQPRYSESGEVITLVTVALVTSDFLTRAWFDNSITCDWNFMLQSISVLAKFLVVD